MARTLVTTASLLAIAVGAASAAPGLAAPPDYYRFLDRAATGAAGFTRAHPTWDGRGVVIAVLDTGVDPSVPGLQKTSTGALKVIEARDFTGEGDVKLEEVRDSVEDGVHVLRTRDGVVRGHDALKTRPAAGEALHLGFFREAALENSSVTDLDRDGHSDGAFAVLAFRRDGDRAPVFVVDTDGDGDLADEEARRSYRDEPRWFAFQNPDPKKNQTPVALAATVLLDEDKVSLHFDDGGHGTHVAGIASGAGIGGRAGFDGIAPGAQVISLKIGHGALAGGATVSGSMRDAIAYASRWAKEHQVPVVMNLSYGIGSEIEGQSDIDRVLDDALRDNRLLLASVSAGNDGPGLSTVGTPAAARLAWTAGALLLPKNAEALWGGRIAQEQVFGFSSRGGELDKPDGLTPGVAWSTVPPFLERAVMAGTSMASPQATGVHALLVSAALAEGVPWTSGKVLRALRSTARALPGYTSLDQGAGVVRVEEAWQALKRQAKHATGQVVAGWRVETPVPSAPGTQASGSYWRVGAYLPEPDERVKVEVSPIFFGDVSDADKQRAFDELDVDTDAGWLRADRGSFALRGAGKETLRLALDSKRLAGKPGLYVGHVKAEVAGVEAFSVPVTVVVPERFVTQRSRVFTGTLAPGEIGRTFVEVPPGATAMIVTLETPRGRFGDTWLLPYDPDGRPVAEWAHHASSRDAEIATMVRAKDDLAPGVWELDTYASFKNTEPSHWAMRVTFRALEVPPAARYTVPDGGLPRATLTVTNRFDERFRGEVEATVDASERLRPVTVHGAEARETITVGPTTDHVSLQLELEKRTYNRFTDVAVDLLDESGRAVAQGGFGTRFCTLDAAVGPGRYTLRLIGAAARSADDAPWTFQLREVHRRATPVTLDAEGPDGRAVSLYPGVPTDLALSAPRAFDELPDGFYHRLTLTFRAVGGDLWVKLALPFRRTRE
ncbi:MAG: hypothetical protein EP329_25970 [Deltaproteobacteria bacterium]|nr:MAG: hypothetical protein EP329_25970 [Deltaproteobacteria bacterium]